MPLLKKKTKPFAAINPTLPASKFDFVQDFESTAKEISLCVQERSRIEAFYLTINFQLKIRILCRALASLAVQGKRGKGSRFSNSPGNSQTNVVVGIAWIVVEPVGSSTILSIAKETASAQHARATDKLQIADRPQRIVVIPTRSPFPTITRHVG